MVYLTTDEWKISLVSLLKSRTADKWKSLTAGSMEKSHYRSIKKSHSRVFWKVSLQISTNLIADQLQRLTANQWKSLTAEPFKTFHCRLVELSYHKSVKNSLTAEFVKKFSLQVSGKGSLWTSR